MNNITKVELISSNYIPETYIYKVGEDGVTAINAGNDFISILYELDNYEVNISKKVIDTYTVTRG